MAGNTHLDALVAEMLGDIGKLHDEIRSLKDEALPAIVTDAEAKLSRVVGVLVNAAKNYESALNEATQKTVAAAKTDIRLDATLAKADAIADLRQAVREAAAHPVADVVGQLNTAVARANAQQGRSLQHALVMAVVGGVVAGAIVLGGGYFLLNEKATAVSAQMDDTPAPARNLKKGSKHE